MNINSIDFIKDITLGLFNVEGCSYTVASDKLQKGRKVTIKFIGSGSASSITPDKIELGVYSVAEGGFLSISYRQAKGYDDAYKKFPLTPDGAYELKEFIKTLYKERNVVFSKQWQGIDMYSILKEYEPFIFESDEIFELNLWSTNLYLASYSGKLKPDELEYKLHIHGGIGRANSMHEIHSVTGCVEIGYHPVQKKWVIYVQRDLTNKYKEMEGKIVEGNIAQFFKIAYDQYKHPVYLGNTEEPTSVFTAKNILKSTLGLHNSSDFDVIISNEVKNNKTVGVTSTLKTTNLLITARLMENGKVAYTITDEALRPYINMNDAVSLEDADKFKNDLFKYLDSKGCNISTKARMQRKSPFSTLFTSIEKELLYSNSKFTIHVRQVSKDEMGLVGIGDVTHLDLLNLDIIGGINQQLHTPVIEITNGQYGVIPLVKIPRQTPIVAMPTGTNPYSLKTIEFQKFLTDILK